MSYETDRYSLQKQSGKSWTVSECGIQICHPGHESPELEYKDYSMHFILEGRGRYCVGGKSYEIGPGQGFLITPGTKSIYIADRQKPWKYIYVCFSGLDAENLVRKVGLGKEQVIFAFPLEEDLVRNIYAMHSAGKRNEADGYDVTGYFLLVMSRLIRANLHNRELTTRPEQYVKKAQQYIEDNYPFRITVSDLAKHVGVERTYLYRIFMRQAGCSPQEYLAEFRLGKAAKMLRESAVSIGEICAVVGFQDVSYFYRVFAKKYGCTPKRYRKISWEQKLQNI